MPCSKSRMPSGLPMKQPSQPAQPGVGLQLQPFSGGSFWSRRRALFHGSLRSSNTVPQHGGHAKMACSVRGKGVPDKRRGPPDVRPGAANAAVKPTLGDTEPLATSGFTSQGFWKFCRCRNSLLPDQKTSRESSQG